MIQVHTEAAQGGLALAYFSTDGGSRFTPESALVKELNLQLLTKESKGSLYVSPALVGRLSSTTQSGLH